MSVAALVARIAPRFSGQLLQPTDVGYDEARRVHNGLVDKRPSIIARCHGTADIADAVKMARGLNLESDRAIDAMIETFGHCPSPMSQIVIEHFHGAASRVPVQDTACAMRVTGFNVVLISQWMDPAENDRHIAWCRDTYAKLAHISGRHAT